jgi:ribonuclease-3
LLIDLPISNQKSKLSNLFGSRGMPDSRLRGGRLGFPEFLEEKMNTQENREKWTLPEVAQLLGLKFKDHRLLARALTHRSYVNEHSEAIEDNERLEFLGDAVLDFLVGAWLYNHFPELQEGGLTRLRAGLVGNNQLAEYARQIELGTVMRLGYGEAAGGGRDRSALLGCTFEAVVGAVYLDQGMDAVRQFVEPLLESAHEVLATGGRDSDPKSRLQEWAQANGFGSPIYHTVGISGPEHERVFEMAVLLGKEEYARGSGPSKNTAAKAAAQAALDKIELW